ncbi:hypothetical protein [Flexivirga sp. B27]
MATKLLPTREELTRASSADLLDAALTLAATAFDSARTDRDPLTKDELLAQVAASQQVANSALATQAVRVAQAAAHQDVFDPKIADTRTIRHHLGFADEWIDTEIAPLLGLGTRQASTCVQHALDAVTRAPRLLTEAGTGSLDPTKIGVVTDQLAGAGRRTYREAERAMLDQGIAGLTTTQLRRRLTKLLASLEPAAVTPAAEKRRRDQIGVFTRPHHEPGLAELVAILPTGDVAAAQRAIDEHARQLHADSTTDKTLAECRADAFIDLLLRNASVETTVVFHLPVRPDGCESPTDPGTFGERSTGPGDPIDDELNALLDGVLGRCPSPDDPATYVDADAPWDTSWLLEAERPGDLDDYDELFPDVDWDRLLCEARRQSSALDRGGTAVATKPPTADTRPLGDSFFRKANADSCFDDVVVPGVGVIPAAEVAQLTRAVGTRVTRVLTDPTTGTTLATTTRKYRPTAAIRHFVTTRDQHCRFPGCSVPAARCDLDHVEPWPLGSTTPTNLHCLCRHHHRAKHETGWSVAMTPDGVCTWTSPSGRTYRTSPGD